MNSRAQSDLRQAIIAEFARQLPNQLGRTAIVKLMYFLQSLRNVQLGYSFRLYNYGPYDGQVLEDLKLAEAANAIKTSPFSWPGGSGYTISPTDSTNALLDRLDNDIADLRNDIAWVIKEFGNRSASDLELASTIIFVEHAEHGDRADKPKLDLVVQKVHAIKPHHDEKKIRSEILALQEKRLVELES